MSKYQKVFVLSAITEQVLNAGHVNFGTKINRKHTHTHTHHISFTGYTYCITYRNEYNNNNNNKSYDSSRSTCPLA